MLDPVFLKMSIRPPTTFAACCGALYFSGWPYQYADYSTMYDANGLVLPNPNGNAYNASIRPLTHEDCREIMRYALRTTIDDVERFNANAEPLRPGNVEHPFVNILGGHAALLFAILNTRQRAIWHETFIEFGWVELGAAYNYANDCHLYMITVKRPVHMSVEDWRALPFTKAKEQLDAA